jgi:hypothetical protein
MRPLVDQRARGFGHNFEGRIACPTGITMDFPAAGPALVKLAGAVHVGTMVDSQDLHLANIVVDLVHDAV